MLRGEAANNLIGQVLPLEPKLQVAFHPAIHFQKSNSGIALLIVPRNLALKPDRKLGSWQGKADFDRAGHRECPVSAKSDATLTEVQEIRSDAVPRSAAD